MYANRDDWIEGLEAQRPGFSLDQAFYQGPAIFRRYCERVFRQLYGAKTPSALSSYPLVHMMQPAHRRFCSMPWVSSTRGPI